MSHTFETYNSVNINRVADVIENQVHVNDDRTHTVTGFNMNRYKHYCGTPACIAGWSASLALPKGEPLPEDNDTIIEISNEFLGLDDHAEYHVYLGGDAVCDLRKVTPEMAVKFLRNLAETGVADWEAVGYENHFDLDEENQ